MILLLFPALHVAIACLAFFLLGRWVLVRTGADVDRVGAPLVFSSILTGQMAAWSASYGVLPINAAIARATGFALPISVILWAFVIALLVHDRARATSASNPMARAALGIVAVGGAAALLKASVVYSAHLGALGLDTHQHLYWVNQILDAGYVPLASRHTEVLAAYPRAFHLLVALWSSAGFGAHAGPIVKLMPFAQTLLPLLAFVELMVARRLLESNGKEANQRGGAMVTAVGLIVLLLVLAFALSHMIYPEYDLNSTPRYASSGALVFPYLVLVFARVFGLASGERLALLTVPVIASIVCALNVVLVGQMLAFLLPLVWLSLLATRADAAMPSRPLSKPVIAAAFVIPVFIALGDPFLVTWWTRLAGPLGDGFLASMGVVSQETMTLYGVASEMDFTQQAKLQPAVAGLVEIAGLAGRSVVDGASSWASVSGASFPFQNDLFSDVGRSVTQLSCLLLAATGVMAARRTSRELQCWFERRIWIALVAATAIAGLAGIMGWRFVSGLAEGRSYAFTLLRDYTAASAANVSLIALGLLLLASGAVLLAALPFDRWLARRNLGRGAIVTLALLVAALPFALYPVHDEADDANFFWTSIDEQDLEDLRIIEAAIDPWDVVLVPAAPWRIGDERWIVPQGPTASVLPYARRRLIFNASLGFGASLNWKDLAAFCNASESGRRSFLKSHGVRFVMIKGEHTGAAGFPGRYRICGASLASLGASHPPTVIAGDLALYEVGPTTEP